MSVFIRTGITPFLSVKMKRMPACVLILWAAVFSITACSPEQPLKIGFIAGLSGRVADLGGAGRNGAMLAVEEVNATGGISGRPIQLIVKDDQQNTEAAKAGMNELVASGVAVIIGPMTSSVAMDIVPIANAAGITLVSPTVTTMDLAGMDDQFIRVISTTGEYSARSADYHYNRLGYRRIVAIYDTSNLSYTESWFVNYKASFSQLGGSVERVHTFRSGDDTTFHDGVKRLLDVSPDCVLIISNAVDAALISHQVRKLDTRTGLAMAEWASTERLIEMGGSAVEGAHVTQFLDRNNRSERYLKFNEAFRNRFGQEPGFAGIAGYDAAMVTIQGLKNAGERIPVKQAILDQQRFQCVQEIITIDRLGDANRSIYVTLVRNGRYVGLE